MSLLRVTHGITWVVKRELVEGKEYHPEVSME